MPVKKFGPGTAKVIWGNRTEQANVYADTANPHRTPDPNDPEWDELVDDAILQSRTTDQTLLSNLEVNADKSFIARYGSTAGYRFRQSPSAGGGLKSFADTVFNAVTGVDDTMIRDSQGNPFLRIKDMDSDFNGASMINPIFNKPTLALASGIIGWDSAKDQYVYGSGDLIGELLGLYSSREIVVNKFFGFHSKSGTPQSYGMPVPTVILEGTGAAAAELLDINTTSTQYTTGNASGNRAGVQSSTFALARRGHLPIMGCTFRTPTSLADVRLWIVLTNADIGATDDPASGHLIGLRFSSTTDTQFRSVTKDGTTLLVNGFGAGITPVANTAYKFFIVWITTARAVLAIRNFAGTVLGAKIFTTNLPGATTNLGFQATLETKTAASKVWALSALKVEHV